MLELSRSVFFGTSAQFVLIVAGIHTSEQSGVEVARWIQVKLAVRPQPTRFGAVIIPEVFPTRGVDARTDEWRTGSAGDKWREITLPSGQKLFPARHFPPPGRPLSALPRGVLIDRSGTPLRDKQTGGNIQQLPEIAYVARVIETLKPVRIVSVHGKLRREKRHLTKARNDGIIQMTDDEINNWDGVTAVAGVNFPGIFVDPRYQLSNACTGFDLEPCKFDLDMDPAFPTKGASASKRFDSARTADGRKDDALALAAAKAVADATLVTGNHLGDPMPIVHYAKEGDTPDAFSLGDWGPVTVTTPGNAPGGRPGAPVFTIEVKDNEESWAFLDGVQVMEANGTPRTQQPLPAERAAGRPGRPYTTPQRFNKQRSTQLQAYAQAIIDTILELP